MLFEIVITTVAAAVAVVLRSPEQKCVSFCILLLCTYVWCVHTSNTRCSGENDKLHIQNRKWQWNWIGEEEQYRCNTHSLSIDYLAMQSTMNRVWLKVSIDKKEEDNTIIRWTVTMRSGKDPSKFSKLFSQQKISFHSIQCLLLFIRFLFLRYTFLCSWPCLCRLHIFWHLSKSHLCHRIWKQRTLASLRSQSAISMHKVLARAQAHTHKYSRSRHAAIWRFVFVICFPFGDIFQPAAIVPKTTTTTSTG